MKRQRLHDALSGVPKHVLKLVQLRGLAKSARGFAGKETTNTYNPSPEGYFFEETTQIKQTNHSETINSFKFAVTNVGEDDMSVGPCIVHVSDYRIDYPDRKVGMVETENWFSKELGASVKTVNRFRDKDGKEHADTLDTVGIETDFVPLQ